MNETNSLYTEVPKMHQGHTLFEINHITKEVLPVTIFKADGKSIIYPQAGCEYVAALNMPNAIKKYNKGK